MKQNLLFRFRGAVASLIRAAMIAVGLLFLAGCSPDKEDPTPVPEPVKIDMLAPIVGVDHAQLRAQVIPLDEAVTFLVKSPGQNYWYPYPAKRTGKDVSVSLPALRSGLKYWYRVQAGSIISDSASFVTKTRPTVSFLP